MSVSTTILFAYRNRDVTRVQQSLQSLQTQTDTDFKVFFIDYGSDTKYAKAVEEVVNQFDFATYYYLGHPGLLWNKSKAINYGLKKAKTRYVITADVDVLFAPDFIVKAQLLKQPDSFALFKIGYLSKSVSQQQNSQLNLVNVSTTHIGDTFGIGLYPTSVLENIRGLDEFFHFYGSEDEDLNMRVQLTGAKLFRCEELLLYHQWHIRYPQKRDNKLTLRPRLSNVLRINQRHFHQNKEYEISRPNDENWGYGYKSEDAVCLELPNVIFKLNNIAANVVHFLEEELPNYCKGVIEVLFEENTFYNSTKFKAKQLLGKQTQSYLSMKEVNDLVLKTILFRYRNYNYNFSISKDLKQIIFKIDLDSLSRN